MIEPTENDIGRTVLYHPGSGLTLGLPERGVITSFNATMVFVRYGADTGSKATKREHLHWEMPSTLSRESNRMA